LDFVLHLGLVLVEQRFISTYSTTTLSDKQQILQFKSANYKHFPLKFEVDWITGTGILEFRENELL
jgi:hypothetical protein